MKRKVKGKRDLLKEPCPSKKMKKFFPRFLFQSPRITSLSKSATSTLVLFHLLVFLSWCLFSWFLHWLFGGWSFCDRKTGCSPEMSKLKPLNFGHWLLLCYLLYDALILIVHCPSEVLMMIFLSIKCYCL